LIKIDKKEMWWVFFTEDFFLYKREKNLLLIPVFPDVFLTHKFSL
jgi:hypothetical protein